MSRDISAGLVRLDENEMPQPVGSRPRDPAKRVHREGILVSDGPPVSTRREATPYEDQLWSEFQEKQRDRRFHEGAALVQIEQNRKARERRDNPRKRRVQFQKYEDGRWHIFYSPDRRSRLEIELEFED